MNNSFKSIGISDAIVKAVDAMGFTEPTVVQSKSIPHVLSSDDLIVMAKTGSGKTGAFGIPILEKIDTEKNTPQALILTPTRELAVQVDSELKKMSKHINVKTTAVYGQHSMNTEILALDNNAMIVTGTPGRVFDHIGQKNLITKDIKYLVLDEADRMLDMGFIDQVVKIIKTLPKDRVTLLFSATMPAEIQKICREYMKSPVTIEIDSDTKTVDSIKQVYYRVDAQEKRTQLNKILMVEQPNSCMIFCNTRIAVDKVHAYLSRKGYVSDALHGANSQSSRLKTIGQFKKGAIQILVATDVAARGIHIDDLSLVINFDVPKEKDSYVHRIGRTGRAGNGGKAITMVTKEEIMSLYEIEEHVGAIIEEEEIPTDEFAKQCLVNATNKWVDQKFIEEMDAPRRSKSHLEGSSNKTRPSHLKHTHTKVVPTRPSKHKEFKDYKDYKDSADEASKKVATVFAQMPASKTDSRPDSRPGQRTVQKPAHKPVQKPVSKPVSKPISKPVPKPVEKPVSKPINTPIASVAPVVATHHSRPSQGKKVVAKTNVRLKNELGQSSPITDSKQATPINHNQVEAKKSIFKRFGEIINGKKKS